MYKGLTLENIFFGYETFASEGKKYTLQNLSLEISPGEYVGILGQTGSGKSTMMQLCNGLLKPTEGTVYYDGIDIHTKGYSLRKHRMKVAYCFQYPEYQLFEESVIKDICYGLRNQGLSEEESMAKAREAMTLLGLEAELAEVSPFMLSGGQKRKVALAGLLAMEPEVLLLDEPVAGLDYQAKKNLFQILKKINQEKHTTIILVSHNMNDIAEQADRVVVLGDGKIINDGSCRDILGNQQLLEVAGLATPDTVRFYLKLQEGRGALGEADKIPVTVEELAKYIAGMWS